jgi:cobaltochelatase CobN
VACRRIFSSAPGSYGAAVGHLVESGRWQTRADLARAWIAASAFAYGAGAEGHDAALALEGLLAETDVVLQAQDAREFDLLDSSEFFESQGGLAAAVDTASGRMPALYHVDTSALGRVRVRRLAEELALAVRGRAANPLWIAGCRRHGYRGAAEMAQTVTALLAFAAVTGQVPGTLFEAVHDAYLGDPETRAFLETRNPAATREIAARFAEAIDRGLWTPTRNSLRRELDEFVEEAT